LALPLEEEDEKPKIDGPTKNQSQILSANKCKNTKRRRIEVDTDEL
jgi:hypothetical protein